MTANDNLNSADAAPVPTDLALVSGMADRLARTERAVPGPTFEDRLFMATRAAIAHSVPSDVAQVAALLDDLGSLDRAGAPASLEARLAHASTPNILVPTENSLPAVHVTWRSRYRLVVAAALAVVAGGSAWLATRPNTPESGLGTLRTDLLAMAASISESSPLAAFDDLHRDLDALDQSVRGSWFPSIDTSADEESL